MARHSVLREGKWVTTNAEDAALTSLETKGPRTLKQVANDINLSYNYTTKLLRSLEEQELVTHYRDDNGNKIYGTPEDIQALKGIFYVYTANNRYNLREIIDLLAKQAHIIGYLSGAAISHLLVRSYFTKFPNENITDLEPGPDVSMSELVKARDSFKSLVGILDSVINTKEFLSDSSELFKWVDKFNPTEFLELDSAWKAYSRTRESG